MRHLSPMPTLLAMRHAFLLVALAAVLSLASCITKTEVVDSDAGAAIEPFACEPGFTLCGVPALEAGAPEIDGGVADYAPYCADLDIDHDNCGACGKQCPPSTLPTCAGDPMPCYGGKCDPSTCAMP